MAEPDRERMEMLEEIVRLTGRLIEAMYIREEDSEAVVPRDRLEELELALLDYTPPE